MRQLDLHDSYEETEAQGSKVTGLKSVHVENARVRSRIPAARNMFPIHQLSRLPAPFCCCHHIFNVIICFSSLFICYEILDVSPHHSFSKYLLSTYYVPGTIVSKGHCWRWGSFFVSLETSKINAVQKYWSMDKISGFSNTLIVGVNYLSLDYC